MISSQTIHVFLEGGNSMFTVAGEPCGCGAISQTDDTATISD